MIELTRLNRQLMVVNSDLIKYAESSPDTMLTLVTGEKIVVLEPCAEVVRRITAYRATLLSDVLKHLPGEGVAGAATTATAATGLRAFAADLRSHHETLDSQDDLVQQRRRREE